MQAGSAYAATTVRLSDGSDATIRAIRPDDARRLQALFGRLSPESIFLRFLAPHKQLTDDEARTLADLDFERRVALVAITRDAEDEQIIGVARYSIVDGGKQGSAEAAIVVEDRYQRKGLGRQLLRELAVYARGKGVCVFTSSIFYANLPILQFVRRSGMPHELRQLGQGELELDVCL